MKVGDYVWWFDLNHRIYKSGGSGPVWREHWVKRLIVGETKVSWVLSGRTAVKVSKVDLDSESLRYYARDEREIDEHEWAYQNANLVHNAVYQCSPSQLRKIAAIVNLKEAYRG